MAGSRKSVQKSSAIVNLRCLLSKPQKLQELKMIDLLLWGGLAVLIGGVAVIAARKPTV
jgi:hypothetical protein